MLNKCVAADKGVAARRKCKMEIVEEPTKILHVIRERYPGLEARIQELYDRDEDFQALCVDYVSCLDLLKDYEKEIHEQDRSIEEYKAVIRDLEKELNEFLGKR